MTEKTIKVALIQMSCDEDQAANEKKAADRIRDAADEGAGVICLPELFRNRYFCQSEDHDNFRFAEPIPGPTSRQFGQLARETGTHLVVPLFERRAAGIYHNSVLVVDPGGEVVLHYRKVHIPDDPLYFEKFYFTPGDRGYPVCQGEFGGLGVLICWDQWFPEAARLSVLAGAELLFYPTAIGWHPSEKDQWGESQLDAWLTIHKAHAICNGVFVAAVNRVGRESDLEFWGNSHLVDPFGNTLAVAGSQEKVLIVDCDLGLVEQARQHWPFLRDRRVDSYHDLLKIFSDPSTQLDPPSR